MRHVQFSKKIVVAVTTCVTIICVTGMFLTWNVGNADSLTAIIKAFIDYATIVFACYSGNSIAEKIITSRAPIIGAAEIRDKEDETDGMG